VRPPLHTNIRHLLRDGLKVPNTFSVSIDHRPDMKASDPGRIRVIPALVPWP